VESQLRTADDRQRHQMDATSAELHEKTQMIQLLRSEQERTKVSERLGNKKVRRTGRGIIIVLLSAGWTFADSAADCRGALPIPGAGM